MGERADFGTRLVAYLIDAVILSVVDMIVWAIFGMGLGRIRGIGGVFIFLGWLAIMVITWGYLIYFWTTTGQTIGKKVMKIKVVDTQGQPLTIGKAILRVIGYAVSGMVFYLGFLWILWDPEKQGWHDKIAGTYVVRVP